MHYMFCVSGFAGVGKDEFCKRLVKKHGALHTGLIDSGKRHMAEVYGFTENQLFGPSQFRNAGDTRYPKRAFFEAELYRPEVQDDHQSIWLTKDGKLVLEGDPEFWLSPREALQRYGELLNLLYQDTWIDAGIQLHRTVYGGGYQYNRMQGLVRTNESIYNKERFISCFSDFRHKNEINKVRSIQEEDFKAVLIRVKSPKVPSPKFDHRSETEQLSIMDSEFDKIVINDGSIDDLYNTVDKIVEEFIQ